MDRRIADKYYDMALISACRLLDISLNEFDEYDPLHVFCLNLCTVHLYNTYKGEDPEIPLRSCQYGDRDRLEQLYEETKTRACQIAGIDPADFDEYEPRHQFYLCLATQTFFIWENTASKARVRGKIGYDEDLELDPLSAAIYERLAQWRNREADSRNLPRYAILSNKTLKAIALNMPSTPHDLQYIKGIGPVLQKKYGDEILRIVQEGRRVTPNTHPGATEEQQKQKIEEAFFSDFPI